jgi:hypothetical protein
MYFWLPAHFRIGAIDIQDWVSDPMWQFKQTADRYQCYDEIELSALITQALLLLT